jgi:hypothetical protein
VLSADYTREDSGGLANTLVGTTETVPGNFAGTTNLPGTAFDPTGTTGFLFGGLYNFCIGATPSPDRRPQRPGAVRRARRPIQPRPARGLDGWGQCRRQSQQRPAAL